MYFGKHAILAASISLSVIGCSPRVSTQEIGTTDIVRFNCSSILNNTLTEIDIIRAFDNPEGAWNPLRIIQTLIDIDTMVKNKQFDKELNDALISLIDKQSIESSKIKTVEESSTLTKKHLKDIFMLLQQHKTLGDLFSCRKNMA